MIRRVAALALAATVSLAVPAVAAAPKKVTRNGVGQVKLGAKHSTLKAKGVVGNKIPGCELAGPGQKAARLTGALEGAVQLTTSAARRVRTIIVTKGAEAKGVGIGATRAKIEKRFPNAKVDTSTEEVFGLTLVTIPRSNGGRFQFGVEVKTKRVSLIGVPFIAFCE